MPFHFKETSIFNSNYPLGEEISEKKAFKNICHFIKNGRKLKTKIQDYLFDGFNDFFFDEFSLKTWCSNQEDPKKAREKAVLITGYEYLAWDFPLGLHFDEDFQELLYSKNQRIDEYILFRLYSSLY